MRIKYRQEYFVSQFLRCQAVRYMPSLQNSTKVESWNPILTKKFYPYDCNMRQEGCYSGILDKK